MSRWERFLDSRPLRAFMSRPVAYALVTGNAVALLSGIVSGIKWAHYLNWIVVCAITAALYARRRKG